MADVLNQVTGASATGDAIQSGANAQLAQQRSDRQAALTYSPEELQQMQQSITLNQQDVQRKQKLLDSADPALIEAGKQATELLQGKASAALAPLQNQRAQQRAQLEQTLASQLGGDYATSSAGIQALNNFDQQTANTLATAQQQTLGQLLGVTQNTEQFGNQQSNIGNTQNLFGTLSRNRISAIQGTGINGELTQAGNIYKAQAGQKTLGTLLGVGAGALAGGAGGALFAGASSAGSGSAPSTGLDAGFAPADFSAYA